MTANLWVFAYNIIFHLLEYATDGYYIFLSGIVDIISSRLCFTVSKGAWKCLSGECCCYTYFGLETSCFWCSIRVWWDQWICKWTYAGTPHTLSYLLGLFHLFNLVSLKPFLSFLFSLPWNFWTCSVFYLCSINFYDKSLWFVYTCSITSYLWYPW